MRSVPKFILGSIAAILFITSAHASGNYGYCEASWSPSPTSAARIVVTPVFEGEEGLFDQLHRIGNPTPSGYQKQFVEMVKEQYGLQNANMSSYGIGFSAQCLPSDTPAGAITFWSQINESNYSSLASVIDHLKWIPPGTIKVSN